MSSLGAPRAEVKSASVTVNVPSRVVSSSSWKVATVVLALLTLGLSIAFPVAYVHKPDACAGHHIMVLNYSDPDKHCLVLQDGQVGRLHDDPTKCANECVRLLHSNAAAVSSTGRRLESAAGTGSGGTQGSKGQGASGSAIDSVVDARLSCADYTPSYTNKEWGYQRPCVNSDGTDPTTESDCSDLYFRTWSYTLKKHEWYMCQWKQMACEENREQRCYP